LKLYLDASALVKRYVDEVGSDTIVAEMNRADSCSICRVGYVETVRAVARGGELQDVERAERDWLSLRVIEVDPEVTEQAASLSVKTGLRTLDALHLAAALTLPVEHITFATWDVRLHRVARELGLRMLPTTLP
jgi:predicted nucleic acid-binding protein